MRTLMVGTFFKLSPGVDFLSKGAPGGWIVPQLPPMEAPPSPYIHSAWSHTTDNSPHYGSLMHRGHGTGLNTSLSLPPGLPSPEGADGPSSPFGPPQLYGLLPLPEALPASFFHL